MPAIATSSVFPKLSDASLLPLGLFGGTFDPVHFGPPAPGRGKPSLTFGLGGVRWLPAGQPPHRGVPQVTAGQFGHGAPGDGRQSRFHS